MGAEKMRYRFFGDNLEIYQMMRALDREMIPLKARNWHLEEKERRNVEAIAAASAMSAALHQFAGESAGMAAGFASMKAAVDRIDQESRRAWREFGSEIACGWASGIKPGALVIHADIEIEPVADPDGTVSVGVVGEDDTGDYITIEGTAEKYEQMEPHDRTLDRDAFQIEPHYPMIDRDAFQPLNDGTVLAGVVGEDDTGDYITVEGTAVKFDQVDGHYQIFARDAFSERYNEIKLQDPAISTGMAIGLAVEISEIMTAEELRRQDLIDRVWDLFYYRRNHGRDKQYNGRVASEIAWFVMVRVAWLLHHIPAILFKRRKLASAGGWLSMRARRWLHDRGILKSPSLEMNEQDEGDD